MGVQIPGGALGAARFLNTPQAPEGDSTLAWVVALERLLAIRCGHVRVCSARRPPVVQLERETAGSGRESAEMKRPASLVSAIVFWLIALAQLLRVILRVRVTAGSYDIPLWLSSSAFVVLGTLGLWLWRERRE
jgi:hypothetical protein